MKAPPFPVLLTGLCLAGWPVWVWFIAGSMDGSNDASGLLAAVAAIAIVAWTPPQRPVARPLLLPSVCLALYLIATLAGAPPAARALIMALALAALASAFRLGKRLDLALLALCVLALPLAASLQFYFGYPLRVLAGELSVAMLRMGGIAVVRDGALLAWDGKLISIDAPCSGVKMLWAGLFLACALAAGVRLSAARTMAAVALAVVIVIAANAVRAGSLFYLEAGLVSMPAIAHEGIGVVCFAGAALAIMFAVQKMKSEAV